MPLQPAGETASTLTFPKGLKVEVLEQGAEIFRIHLAGNGPIWFGPRDGHPPAYRFDAPAGEYKVLYAADNLEGSFVETILHGKTESRIVSRGFVDQRAWTPIVTQRPLTLMKLYNEGLFWHGADAGVSAAPDYGLSRRLALTAFQEVTSLDGLVYRSRHDNGQLCYALFDRVDTKDLVPGPRHMFVDHRDKIDGLVAKYGACYDTSPPVPLELPPES